ncbi:MAG: hypothetical protein J7L15_03890, partial [Clostridiales bacterium]|nr:hypothetical protein [Clostridiales bacterium]
MANNKELQIVLKAVDNASSEMKKVSKALNGMSNDVKQTSSSFGSMAKAVTVGNLAYGAIVGTVSKLASGLSGLIKESISLTGQLGQSKAVIYKLGENNSWTKKQIDSLVKSIRDENKDMLTSIELTKTAIMTNMSEKQALEIVARGRDVAAASNKNSNDAIKAMMQAVVKLRPELLSEYGIEMNLVKVYKDASSQLGIKTSELTYAQKTHAMYNAIIGEATRMEGSYTEAMGSWYKMSNSVKDGIVSLKLILGDMLDNAIKPMIEYVYKSIKSFRAWAFTEENEINPQLKATADIIGQILLKAFEVLKTTIKTVIDISKSFVDIVKVGIDIVSEYKGLLTIFRTSWENIALVFRENLLPELQKLWEALQPLMPFLEIFAKIIGVILLGALIAVVKILEVSLIVLIQTLANIIEVANAGIEKFKDIWDATTTSISKVVGWIDKLISSIKRLNIVQGAKNAIGNALGFGGARAGGGFVSPSKAYLVGEQGPELFVPNANGNIIPNGRLGG